MRPGHRAGKPASDDTIAGRFKSINRSFKSDGVFTPVAGTYLSHEGIVIDMEEQNKGEGLICLNNAVTSWPKPPDIIAGILKFLQTLPFDQVMTTAPSVHDTSGKLPGSI